MTSFNTKPRAEENQRAINELHDLGVDYSLYCRRFEYAGSPIRLLNDIMRGSKRTLHKLFIILEEQGTC